jgi:CheY-like chemotaxis protein
VKPPILLVEDDPIATALISTFLKEKWFFVAHAESYNTAVSLLKSILFSALLSDTCIPERDQDLKLDLWKLNTSLSLWIDVAKLFKTYYPSIPIIWMSSDPDTKSCWDWVADLFLEKPLKEETFDVLFRMVNPLK